ncbi:GNAT family N-acetyltransferase [Inhella sp.]|uniref:GNAT family N-acetyltransferase n=1 Tax=Inhella sp. TaxID=1921806 RepID=UPI0035AE9974
MSTIRQLTAADLPALLRTQAACYGAGFNEPEAVFAQRLQQSPQSAWCVDDAARPGELAAYLLGYPSRIGQITALHGSFEPVAQPDCLYLHDLAVSPTCQGQALGLRLVQHAWGQATQLWGLRRSALVAVQGSLPFWQRLGYEVLELREPEHLSLLAAYGAEARYCVRQPA